MTVWRRRKHVDIYVDVDVYIKFCVNVYMSTSTLSTSTVLTYTFRRLSVDVLSVDIDVVDLVNNESTLIQKLFRKQAP